MIVKSAVRTFASTFAIIHSRNIEFVGDERSSGKLIRKLRSTGEPEAEPGYVGGGQWRQSRRDTHGDGEDSAVVTVY